MSGSGDLAQKIQSKERVLIKPLRSESFAMGHAELDAQDRRLVEAINCVEAAVHSASSPERLADFMKTLREVAAEHIRRESAILREIRSGTYGPLRHRSPTPLFLRAMADAAIDEHMVEHAKVLAGFDAVSGIPDRHVCETIKVWFAEHWIKHDSRLKAIFQAM